MSHELTVKYIEETLNKVFQPTLLEVKDNSFAHRNHPGAASGGGHFKLAIQAEAFQGISRIEAHRLIYQALDEGMKQKIHALEIRII
jgi:BolA protein